MNTLTLYTQSARDHEVALHEALTSVPWRITWGKIGALLQRSTGLTGRLAYRKKPWRRVVQAVHIDMRIGVVPVKHRS